MMNGLLNMVIRIVTAVAAVCVGVGAMGVDVQGMLHLQDYMMIVRAMVGVCGVISMYYFFITCCHKNGSCRA